MDSDLSSARDGQNLANLLCVTVSADQRGLAAGLSYRAAHQMVFRSVLSHLASFFRMCN